MNKPTPARPPLPLGEVVTIVIHGARVADPSLTVDGEPCWASFTYQAPTGEEMVTVHTGSAAITVAPVRDQPPTAVPAAQAPGTPPGERSALRGFLTLAAAIIAICALLWWWAG